MKKFITLMIAAAALAITPSAALAELWSNESPSNSDDGTLTPNSWSGWSGSHKDNVLNASTWTAFGTHGTGDSQYCVGDPGVTAAQNQNCGGGGLTGGVVPSDAANSPLFFAGYLNVPAAGVHSPACDAPPAGPDGEPAGTARNPDCDSLGGFFVGTAPGSGVGLADEENPS
jgi:hypothetical protein